MRIALCYERVLPARGGCETYIADLAHRLVSDGHQVTLYASAWDTSALPSGLGYCRIPTPLGPRFLRPWRFGRACARALAAAPACVSIGFDKTWGQDILYPQGGLHRAAAAHNLLKYPSATARTLAGWCKRLDVASWSFSALERKQYLGRDRPLIVVNSEMVRRHFHTYWNIAPDRIHVIRSAISPDRFAHVDRPRLREEWRSRWGLAVDEPAGLVVAMNYRLKGLEPLLHAVSRISQSTPFRLLVVGDRQTRAYERLARRLDVADRVRFLGPQREVHLCYFAADFLVHPTFYDPCSLVVLEALACGLPVITSRFNGASELLQPPREGYVIENPHDADHLAWCLTQLLEPARRAACAQAARQTAARWTFEDHYRQLLAVFEMAAERRAAA